MTEELIIEIMVKTLEKMALLCLPIIGTIMIVGIITQIIQSVTQLKDQALSFVPKVFITGFVFVIMIPWYIQQVQQYTEFIFQLIGRARM